MFGIIRQSALHPPAAPQAVRCFSASAIQLKKRDPSLPVAPKNPATPYTLFVKEWFPANKAQHNGPEGKFDLKTISTAMSNAWSALTANDKQTYSDRARDLRKTFDTEYKKWYNELDAETIKSIEAATGKKLAPPGGKKAKLQAQRERPGNPGQPLTAFFEFMREFRQSNSDGKAGSAVAKEAGEAWRQMSEDDKQKYRDTAAEKKAKYLEWQKTLQQ
ncbi:uncharacterized protein MKK02DRAFT_39625 [Dioszegia hungarica]|uniref:HMG box domain-containing protein n=1 Tax=Dioszegia hungarica TaxID=4972 RepID=A0AA38HGS9_9TREE|nr:uncharacterized protein MKK02DRAFT_39625 [Dioszegia hungarica]KAI9639326.1 hypothetical protein MKK02DRAFT_39625 [Dioszegia hungarica]